MDRDHRHDQEDHFSDREFPEPLEEHDEEEAAGGSRPAWLLRLAAAIALVAFMAFSYAWLPLIAPARFEFLRQDRQLSSETVVKASKPAVVSIQATIPDGIPGSTRGGTGFNIAEGGLVVTNRHVVEGAASIRISFSDGQSFFSNKYQIVEGYDLALVRIKGQGLPVLQLADTLPAAGEEVTIIGNPLGFERVSARGPVEGYYNGGEAGATVFAIRAIVEPGSSGSPVLNRQNRVCGVVYAITSTRKDGKEVRYSLAIPAAALKADNPGS